MRRKNIYRRRKKNGQSLSGEGTDGMANKSEELSSLTKNLGQRSKIVDNHFLLDINLIQHWVSSRVSRWPTSKASKFESKLEHGRLMNGNSSKNQIWHQQNEPYSFAERSCKQLSSGRTKAHSNDMRFSASSELSAGVSMANINKLSQSSMASGQTIRSL